MSWQVQDLFHYFGETNANNRDSFFKLANYNQCCIVPNVFSGGSSGRGSTLPTDHNFFNFTGFFSSEISKNVGSASPSWGGRNLLRRVMDPPLACMHCVVFFM